MTKSAIEQMVEYLDSVCKGTAVVSIGEITETARRLLSEEQAQKPTAPAGLVEELGRLIPHSLRPYKDDGDTWWASQIKEIISRYRPAPSSDEGLRELKDYIENKTPKFELKNCSTDFGIYYCAVIQEINRILYRHPTTAKSADRCAELVKELEVMLDGRNDYFMHLNGEAMKNRAFIPKQMIQELVSEFSEDADGKEGRI